jgi:hypothetical protein
MKYLNSLEGFKYAKPISEKGSHSCAIISGEYYRIEDCVEKTDGVWEGTLVKYNDGDKGFVREEERILFTPPKLDPHTIIQSRDWNYDDLRYYTTAIDEHVSQCPDCENILKRSGGAVLLPRLRAKITVPFPEPKGWEYMGQLEQLKPGQCLPCGCIVLDVKWSREQAVEAFYKALAKIMQVSEEHSRRIEEQTKLLDLPLTTKSLRRLRDQFWLPDGSLGSAKGRDEEEGEVVRQLPETVGEFINQILKVHFGMSWIECTDHWSP